MATVAMVTAMDMVTDTAMVMVMVTVMAANKDNPTVIMAVATNEVYKKG